MKYRFLTILTITVFSFTTSVGQNLEVSEVSPTQQGNVGQDIRTTLKVKNVSDQPVYFRVYEVSKQIGSSQKNLICISGNCFSGKVAQGREDIKSMIRKVNPGMIDEAISLVLESGLVTANSNVTYRIENIKNPSEYYQIELQYEVSDPKDDGLLYSSKNVDLSDVYPNPVREMAIFDYNIKNDSKEAKIIIHNVLGTIAGEYQLNPFEQQLKVSVENFNPGVYFYSLYIDNEGVATKKLVVRK